MTEYLDPAGRTWYCHIDGPTKIGGLTSWDAWASQDQHRTGFTPKIRRL